MGYRIDYPPIKKIRNLERRHSRFWALTGLFLAFFLVGTLLFWPDGRHALKELLLPGDPAVTVAALENLSGQLHDGVSIESALEQFCQDVLTASHVR